MICINCRAEINSKVNYCWNCGIPIPVKKEGEMSKSFQGINKDTHSTEKRNENIYGFDSYEKMVLIKKQEEAKQEEAKSKKVFSIVNSNVKRTKWTQKKNEEFWMNLLVSIAAGTFFVLPYFLRSLNKLVPPMGERERTSQVNYIN